MKQFLFIAILFAACGNPSSKPAEENTSPKDSMQMHSMQSMDSTQMHSSSVNKFPGIAFASTKDLSCGMPLSAGIEDTASYEGKTYGFCSKECKDAFLKDPKSYSAKTK